MERSTIGVNTTGFTGYTSGGIVALSGKYPATVGFYGGRVFHGGSVLDPDFIFGCMAPDPLTGATRYDTFTTGSSEDDAVAYALTSASSTIFVVAVMELSLFRVNCNTPPSRTISSVAFVFL